MTLTNVEDTTVELVQCIYASAASKPFSSEELENLLSNSRKNNKTQGITGILLYHEQSFFQILEGRVADIERTFRTISDDDRHSNIIKLIEEEIEERSFGDWSMGYPKVSQGDLESIKGLNDFFSRQWSYTTIGEGRAKILLEAFKNGQWRQGI